MEIPVLNILRPYQNGPYRLLSILKTLIFQEGDIVENQGDIVENMVMSPALL